MNQEGSDIAYHALTQGFLIKLRENFDRVSLFVMSITAVANYKKQNGFLNRFFKANSMKHFLGIDPGKEGFFVTIDQHGKLVEAFGIPQIGNEYDKKAILEYFTENEFQHIVLENPGMIFGASKSSVASLQKCISLIEGLLFASGKSHTLVAPKTWQATMWKHTVKQYKTGTEKKQVDTKATSLLAAMNLFPEVNFKVTKKGSASKNYNDNFVDGILLADYGRRMYISNQL